MKFYDQNGAAKAYLDEDGETIYAWGGKPLAYLDGENIYSFEGKHLGWFEDGWVIDHDGGHSYFTDGAADGPFKPFKQFENVKGFKEFLPFKGFQEFVPFKPFRSAGWGKNLFG
ncbi:hypothetical protein HJC03_23465 [Rhizobium sp. NLR4b]|uniref:4-fold beta flower protein n=1 Tax=Rhizobium sp. NLR4b TaxID=2731118 RepID=UPI001C82B4C3|nr:hypothetical protein [Rhizobium sp. NLR4b]MBX5253331.1 hypothetical protein [Rhizobium sp. NLR4b]